MPVPWRGNCEHFKVPLFDIFDILRHKGIVHVIGPEQGLTQPGMTIVCGDSHTSTHGALGALAFGIGTSEVEHVLATQTLTQVPPKTFYVRGGHRRALLPGVTPKDVILFESFSQIGVDGGTGHVIEYASARSSGTCRWTAGSRSATCPSRAAHAQASWRRTTPPSST